MRQAKTSLSKLLRKAARGEEVIIARGKTPFDRMLILQALSEDAAVVSADKHFDGYALLRIW